MRFYSETLGLPDNAFTILRDLIHERTGLFFENGKRDLLADKLSPRVLERGFDSFLDYYYLLKYDPEADEEWGRVMDALSVQETYFWREMDQVRALVEVIVPEYFARGRPAPLRIWSAAAATGEEPLTIAMALNEAGWFDRAPIEIYASDASPAAIAAARRGVYRERSFRALPPPLRAKYFREIAPAGSSSIGSGGKPPMIPGSSSWQIAPEIHSRVRWSTVNLMDESAVARLAAVPVIFCRNVFIYFSESAIRKTVHLFAAKMPAPAYLCVGSSESLLRITTAFELQEVGGAFVYVKNNG